MTADTYFKKEVPPHRSDAMQLVRQVIQRTLPDAEETMAYKLPTYVVDGEAIVSLASQKHYMALYICHYDLVEKFSEPLSHYNCGKSCIRFKSLKDDTLPLFEEIIQYVRDHLDESTLKGKQVV